MSAQPDTSTSLPAPLDQLAAPPIFVTGTARSGTTWVFEILAAHPEVAGVFESWLFSPQGGVNALFGSRQWADADRVATQDSMIGHRSRLRQLVSREQLVEDVRELVARWLSRALQPQHRFLVEKGAGDLALIDEVFPEARFVHVVRDGRDVAVSSLAAGRSWAPEFRGRKPSALTSYARRWKHEVKATRAAGQLIGDRYLEVRYEDLKTHPVKAYGRLFDFCQIPYDEAVLDRIIEATDFDRQYQGGEDHFRRRGRAGDWKERLGLLDSLRFNLAAGDALVECGYEPSRRWRSCRLLRRRRH